MICVDFFGYLWLEKINGFDLRVLLLWSFNLKWDYLFDYEVKDREGIDGMIIFFFLVVLKVFILV